MDYLGWRKQLENQKEQEYDGSPYFNDNFVQSQLFYSGKYWFKNILLRYNIYHDEIELSDKGLVWAIAPSHLIDKAIIGDDTLVVDSLQSSNYKSIAYYKLLHDGKVTLLLKMNVTLREGQPAKLYTPATPPKFTRSQDEVFVKTGKKKEPEKIKNISALIALINDKQKQLADFVKSEKLGSKKKSDYIRLARYYESL